MALMGRDGADARESLAQEIREGLRVRGLWAPKEPADLITAIFKAIDDLREATGELWKCHNCGYSTDDPSDVRRHHNECD